MIANVFYISKILYLPWLWILAKCRERIFVGRGIPCDFGRIYGRKGGIGGGCCRFVTKQTEAFKGKDITWCYKNSDVPIFPYGQEKWRLYVNRFMVSMSPPVIKHTISSGDYMIATMTRFILSLLITPDRNIIPCSFRPP